MNSLSDDERGIVSEKIAIMEAWNGGLSTIRYQNMVQKLSELSTLPKILKSLDQKMDKLQKDLQGARSKMTETSQCVSKTIEYEAASAIKDYLDDGRILVTSYKWENLKEGFPGDVDTIVTGKMPHTNDYVVVICEAKTDLKSQVGSAVRQVNGNIERWNDMRKALNSDVDAELNNGDEFFLKDISNTRASQFKDLQVIPAVAGKIFDEDTKRAIARRFSETSRAEKWICVQADGMSVDVVTDN